MESDHKSARFSTFPMYSATIAEDLWPDIFKRLPVETLCRFRSVSKSWNSLITSSFLINLQRSFNNTPANLKPYLRSNLLEYSHESYALFYPHDKTHLKSDVHFPFKLNFVKEEDYFTCVDVIHGVVCISYSSQSSFDSTILWNPAIHKYITLPPLPFPSHIESAVTKFDHIFEFVYMARFYCNAIGFGYDACKNDFKVVRIWMARINITDYCASIPTTYEVFSAREGEWRVAIAPNIKSFMFDISTIRTGCFVNGTIHWLASVYELIPASIIAYDCERDELRTMELPQEIKKAGMKIELWEYGGMLSALVQPLRPIDPDDNPIEVWVMDDQESATWKKVYKIHNDCKYVIHLHPKFEKLAPFGPNQWIKLHHVHGRSESRDVYHSDWNLIRGILSDRVYKESMLFIDDPNAKSYTKEDLVPVQCTPYP